MASLPNQPGRSDDADGGPRDETDAPLAGDQGRIASAYRAHAAALYRYALMLTADTASAEDVIQQVFVKLAAIAGRTGLASLAVPEVHYLRRAVRNECYRLLDRRRRDPAVTTGEGFLVAAYAEPAAPADTPDEPEEKEMLERALRRLPPDQREVIHMKIYEQLTFQQIADLLGLPAGTVAGRYRYGLDKLRQWLSPCREELP